MADKPQESSAPRPRSTTGADPSPGPSSDWEWHDVEAARGNVEREVHVRHVASAFVGGALVSMGLQRRSLGGMALALAGGELISRGARGRSLIGGIPNLRMRRLTGRAGREESVVTGGMVMERSVTIQKPGHVLYRAWRDVETLSRVMAHFAEVTSAGPDLRHWKMQGPFGKTLEWDSHVVEEHPGEFLRWESMKGAPLPNAGEVRFRPAPGDWGTVVTLRFRFNPPGGALGEAALKLFGETPTALAHKALMRFKSLVETGEIATTERNPAAREGGFSSF
ncbi:SRPBCC family protein [Pyxidicoccus sp. MSG2]|uniref:SRPBCC family protein n=1 Tax=Pyxidicoccus sp. MSG2 TaxID=2996790 RepID=UPI00226F933F|nr:SRPBCC family protein [Pyxidicoccus sp. MSG2]MCY1017810.1 SRPBCC family protein [Pyxidicoccus sp. MSG2]